MNAHMKPFLYKLTFFIVLLSFGCSKSNDVDDNKDYLTSIASTILYFKSANGRLPESIDEALKFSGKVLLHRGDIHGSPVLYHKIDDNAFLIRSYGRNRVDEKGVGDDVQISLINGKGVSRDALIQYAKEHYPDEWYVHEIALGNNANVPVP